MTDSEFRSFVISKRKNLSNDYKNKSAGIVFDKFIKLNEYKEAENILIYVDYNGEIGTDLIFNQAVSDNKRLFVPLCKENNRLDFYSISSKDDLIAGHYGILEPVEDASKEFRVNDLAKNTICLVPGTVFDKSNNRMGYGKGYYDRFFERFDIKNRIGLAYDFQITEHIDVKSTDVAMTMVITD